MMDKNKPNCMTATINEIASQRGNFNSAEDYICSLTYVDPSIYGYVGDPCYHIITVSGSYMVSMRFIMAVFNDPNFYDGISYAKAK